GFAEVRLLEESHAQRRARLRRLAQFAIQWLAEGWTQALFHSRPGCRQPEVGRPEAILDPERQRAVSQNREERLGYGTGLIDGLDLQQVPRWGRSQQVIQDGFERRTRRPTDNEVGTIRIF